MKRMEVSKGEIDAYIAERAAAPCFICGIVSGGSPQATHHIVYETEEVIVFLSAMPTQYGHVLVCPKRHVEHVFSDLSCEAYLKLQAVAWAVGRALQEVLVPERTYLASFGSQQMNRHVHLHVVPLPTGVPIREQQMAALMPERVGVVHLEAAEWIELRDRLRSAIVRYV